MYSLISILTIFCSSSNRFSARVLASSVLPTPVGPRNRKEPIGLVGSLMPALERRIASVTLFTPSSWPTTLLWSWSSRVRSLTLSPSVSLVTGIPVHLEIILAISSSVTASWTRLLSLSLTLFSSISSCCCNFGSSPYCNCAAFSRS